MCLGSTLSHPHKEFLKPLGTAPSATRSRPAESSTRTRLASARKTVRGPAPVPQMRVPTTRAGQPAPRRTLDLIHFCNLFLFFYCTGQRQTGCTARFAHVFLVLVLRQGL